MKRAGRGGEEQQRGEDERAFFSFIFCPFSPSTAAAATAAAERQQSSPR